MVTFHTVINNIFLIWLSLYAKEISGIALNNVQIPEAWWLNPDHSQGKFFMMQ